MGLNPFEVYARLDSSLFGALVQVVEVLAPAARADAAAARVYEAPTGVPCSYVNARRLGLTEPELAAFRRWPEEPGSLLDWLSSISVPRGAFRPTALHDPPPWQTLFASVIDVREVVDCLCAAVPIDEAAWAGVTVLRCKDSEPFDGQASEALARYQPAAARLLRHGYHREVGMPPNQAPDKNRPAIGPEQPGNQLSRTEQHVLNHLRQGLTERQVADRLGRSRHTVHVHVKSIYRKLNVQSRNELHDLLAGQTGEASAPMQMDQDHDGHNHN